MTAGNDNALIWVVKIELEATPLRYATRTLNLTNDWLGGKIALNSLTGLSQSADLTEGGTVGSLSMLNMNTTKFSLFIDDIAPTTSMPYLTGKRVSLGFVWDTATTDAEITYIFEGYVFSYSAGTNQMQLGIMEYSDIENGTLPYYKIQNTLDNGISYFTKIEDTALGVEIPIVYGDFSGDSINLYTSSILAPCVLVDNTLLKYKVASHPCFETYSIIANADFLYLFDSGLDNFIELHPSNGDTINTLAGLERQIFISSKADGDYATGTTYIFFDSPGKSSEYVDINNVYDFTAGTDFTLPDNKQIGLKSNKSLGNNYSLGRQTTSYQLNVGWSCAGSGEIALSYYNPEDDSYSSAYVDTVVGATTSSTFDAGPSVFTPQNIFNYEWVIKNTSGGATTIDIIDAVLQVNDILVYQFPKRKKVVKVVLQKMPKYNIQTQIKITRL